jgi:hypothetical protein
MSATLQSTTTVGQIINLALKNCGAIGVGQSPRAEDTNDAVLILNQMVGEWSRKRWLVFQLLEESIVSTGALSYTCGPGGDFDINPRPNLISAAFMRQPINGGLPIDYPLEIILAREDYSQIATKTMQAFSSFLFFDDGFPLGNIYTWPVLPATLYELHIIYKNDIAQFTSLAETIALPLEYLNALQWNLSVRLCSLFQLTPSPLLVGMAKDALNTIRQANPQVGRLQMSKTLIRKGNYNIYADQYR